MPLTLSPRVLSSLRQTLERALDPEAAATCLYEAGVVGGSAAYADFAAWLAETRGGTAPSALDVRFFGEALRAFVQQQGFGTLEVAELHPSVFVLDTNDGPEAFAGSPTAIPACDFTRGLLAGLLGEIAGRPVAVTEVECRARGDTRCRFLSGAPTTLRMLREQSMRGVDYARALTA